MIAFAPVTVTSVLLVDPGNTALPDAVPVTAPVRGPTNPAAVQTPAAPTEYATPT